LTALVGVWVLELPCPRIVFVDRHPRRELPAWHERQRTSYGANIDG